jgi:hypothetical protein
MEEKVKKWNFDFCEGKPLDTNNDTHIYEELYADEV